MNSKSIVVLVVILLVLVGLIVLKQRGSELPSITEQVKLNPLLPEDLSKADIARIELTSGAKPEEKLVLQRDADDPDVWRITSHFNAPADTEKVETFVGNVATLKGEPRATAVEDSALADYNLGADTAFQVAVFKQDGAEPAATVLVGEAPAMNQVFMRRSASNDVFVVDKNLKSEAGMTGNEADAIPEATAWVKKQFVTVDRDKVNTVKIETPDRTVAFAREEKPAEEAAPAEGDDAAAATPPAEPEYVWNQTEGALDGFKEAAIQNVLSAVTGTSQVTDVVDPAKKADWGLETPQFVLTLSIEGQDEPVVVQGGRPDPAQDAYVQTPGGDVVYKMSKFTFERFFPKGSDLYNLPALAADAQTMQRVQVTGPEGGYMIAKTGETWAIEQPAAPLAPQDTALTAIGQTIGGLTPISYADSFDGTDLSPAAYTVVATDGSGEHRVEIGSQAAGVDGYYARFPGVDTPMIISKADFDKIMVPRNDLYARGVLDIMAPDIASIQIDRADDAFTATRTDAGWQVNGQAGDATAAESWASSVAGFQVTDIRFGETALPGDPAATVTVTTLDGTAHVLQFGAPANEARPLVIAGMDQLFSVDAWDADAVLVSSASLMPAEGEAEAMEAPAGEAAPEADATPDNPVTLTPDVQPAPSREPITLTPNDEPAPAQAPVTLEVPMEEQPATPEAEEAPAAPAP